MPTNDFELTIPDLYQNQLHYSTTNINVTQGFCGLFVHWSTVPVKTQSAKVCLNFNFFWVGVGVDSVPVKTSAMICLNFHFGGGGVGVFCTKSQNKVFLPIWAQILPCHFLKAFASQIVSHILPMWRLNERLPVVALNFFIIFPHNWGWLDSILLLRWKFHIGWNVINCLILFVLLKINGRLKDDFCVYISWLN